MRAEHYQHSGKVGLMGLVAGTAAAFVAGPILGTVYAVAIAFIPIIYVNIILTALFGAAMGFVITKAMKLGKVRNTGVVMAGAFLGTCVAHYVGWMVWVVCLAFQSDMDVPWLEILFPVTFLMIVVEIGREGAWTIGSSSTPVSGVLLLIVWILEALIVFGASLAVAFFTADSEPFCEGCESWCEPKDDALRLSGHLIGDALAERLHGMDLAVLTESPRAHPMANPWFQVDVARCPSCGETNTLTLSHVAVSHDRKGNRKVDKTPLVKRMLLTAEQAAWVVQIKDTPGPAFKPAELPD